nr:hypothetical protein BaRGS_013701 [Batillaria attramentaria]
MVPVFRVFRYRCHWSSRATCNYGIRGMEMFTDLAGFHNVCIASTDSVASSDSDHEFDRVVDTLKKTPNASVVVCFCEGITVQKLLKAFSRKGVAGKFLIIGR